MSNQLVETRGDDSKQLQVLPENANLQFIPGHGYGRMVKVEKEAVFAKKVKIPVSLKKVMPCTFKKRIKTHKLVEVDDFEEVEEQYTEMVEVEATRDKKIWVQESHWEDFTRKVPVTKTRIVKKPYTRIKEVDEFQMVTVPGTKVELTPGFRIDTKEVRQLVEVEEWEMYTMKPHNTGQTQEGKTTMETVQITQGYSIRAGTQLIPDDEENRSALRARGIDIDSIAQHGVDDNISSLPLFDPENSNAGVRIVPTKEEEEKKRRR